MRRHNFMLFISANIVDGLWIVPLNGTESGIYANFMLSFHSLFTLKRFVDGVVCWADVCRNLFFPIMTVIMLSGKAAKYSFLSCFPFVLQPIFWWISSFHHAWWWWHNDNMLTGIFEYDSVWSSSSASSSSAFLFKSVAHNREFFLFNENRLIIVCIRMFFANSVPT